MGNKKDQNKPFEERLPYWMIGDELIKKIAKDRMGFEKGFYQRNTSKSFLAWLVEQKIVRQVFHHPQCPVCENKADWSSKIDLELPLRCSRCGTVVPTPEAHLDIEYQLNPLVQKAFDQGIRPVALTVAILKSAADNGFLYIPGFKGVYQEKAFDIDIVSVCNGNLIFCECKDMDGVPATANSWIKIKSQLEDLIDKGKLCGARSVVLASLADEYPAAIKKLAKKTNLL